MKESDKKWRHSDDFIDNFKQGQIVFSLLLL